jgi:hypothetical protein
MAREGKGLTGWLLDGGTRFVSRAAEKVMKDPRGQDAVARAVGLAQRGRRRVEELQERLMHAAGIPGRQDYQDLAKQLARIKRKARELAEKLDANAEADADADEGPEDGNGRAKR